MTPGSFEATLRPDEHPECRVCAIRTISKEQSGRGVTALEAEAVAYCTGFAEAKSADAIGKHLFDTLCPEHRATIELYGKMLSIGLLIKSSGADPIKVMEALGEQLERGNQEEHE